MTTNIRVGDVGTSIILRIVTVNSSGTKTAVDISTNSGLNMYFKKPNGATLTKTAVLNTTGTDGRMKYILTAGDIDIKGDWQVQGFVNLGGSGSWKTTLGTFTVEDNIV